MRIHTSANLRDIITAVEMANGSATTETARNEYRARTARARTSITPIHALEANEHRSQTHPRAFEIKLSGDSTRGPNSGQYGMDGYGKAATWDQWGLFLSALFEADPEMRVGGAAHPIYADAEHFHWITANRYRGTVDDNGIPRVDAPTGMFFHPGNGGYHRQHKWEYQGTTVGARAHVSRCACGATLRRADMATYRAFIAPDTDA